MDNRNRDRGTIKWTAMMLPEHVKLLREWNNEDNIVPEPNLDEYDFEELAHQIQTAVQSHSIVRLHYWVAGTEQIAEGTIKELPLNSSFLTVLSHNGNIKIHIPHILKIHVYEG